MNPESRRSRPSVSIGMPVYNGSLSIRAAIESLLKQTFTNFELIISDNASTDDTESICKEYFSKDNRIRYIRQNSNLGANANFKYVLNAAEGVFFMWAAADDYRAPDCIETYMRIIGDAGGAFTNYCRVNHETHEKCTEKIPIINKSDGSRISIKAFLRNNRPSFFYGLYRVNALKDCFADNYFDWSDSYTVLSVIKKYGFNTINGEPKYFAGYFGSYKPKPISGRYINSSEYFWKGLKFAIAAGPLGVVYHLKVVLISITINLKIAKEKRFLATFSGSVAR